MGDWKGTHPRVGRSRFIIVKWNTLESFYDHLCLPRTEYSEYNKIGENLITNFKDCHVTISNIYSESINRKHRKRVRIVDSSDSLQELKKVEEERQTVIWRKLIVNNKSLNVYEVL